MRAALAVWHLRNGDTAELTLALGVGPDLHEIATVQGGALKGRGTAVVEVAPSGGVLRVDGTAAGGTPLRLQVQCARFAELVAEAG
jgi:hypothetical protein